MNDTDFLFYIEILLPIERKWKKSQLRLTFRQWIDMFKPEGIVPARKAFKIKIKKYKEHLKELAMQHEEYQNERINKAHFSEQAELKDGSEKMYEEARTQILKKIKSAVFNLSYLDELEGKITIKVTGGVSEEQITRAKEVPIENFYTGILKKSSTRATGICPFHNETHGSFVIYLEQNSFWCFSCNTGGSVIDFVIKLHNIDFLTAVKKLLM